MKAIKIRLLPGNVKNRVNNGLYIYYFECSGFHFSQGIIEREFQNIVCFVISLPYFYILTSLTTTITNSILSLEKRKISFFMCREWKTPSVIPDKYDIFW